MLPGEVGVRVLLRLTAVDDGVCVACECPNAAGTRPASQPLDRAVGV
jgi:hypothetical protein